MRIAGILFLISTSVYAQTPPSTDALRGAMQACNQHREAQPPIPGIPPPTFHPGWEHCSIILEALQKRNAETLSNETMRATKDLADKLK